MSMSININKEIWEGWTVGDFIEELEPLAGMVMSGASWNKPFINKKELAEWCKDNQPYYKKSIPEVNEYFAIKYGLR